MRNRSITERKITFCLKKCYFFYKQNQTAEMKCFPLNSHIKKEKIITTLNIQKAIVSFKFFRHFMLRFQREKLRKTQHNLIFFSFNILEI